MTVLVGIPVKPFSVAKQRLAPILDAAHRRRLGQAIALRTARVARTISDDVRIATGDPGVAAWARDNNLGVVAEEPGEGLDGAARAISKAARGVWVVLHADLPLLSTSDLDHVLARSSLTVLAPAHDGGTSLVKHEGDFDFAYGRSSFHRHLARAPHAAVVTRPGLALDLDDAWDLATVRSLSVSTWLEQILAPIGSVTP